ncbi:MAG: hypothetical protein LUF04_05395, partial [Bacteroides sp.]|nr:hypothetical protein [Bacteroides sp.]
TRKVRDISTINRVISIVLSISINFVDANIDFCRDYAFYFWIKKKKTVSQQPLNLIIFSNNRLKGIIL